MVVKLTKKQLEFLRKMPRLVEHSGWEIWEGASQYYYLAHLPPCNNQLFSPTADNKCFFCNESIPKQIALIYKILKRNKDE